MNQVSNYFGVRFEKEISIFEIQSNSVKIWIEDPYEKLSLLVLKLANSNPDKIICIKNLYDYFSLPEALAQEINQHLIQNSYLEEVSSGNSRITEMGLDALKLERIGRVFTQNIVTFVTYYPRTYIERYKVYFDQKELVNQISDLQLSHMIENLTKKQEIGIPSYILEVTEETESKIYKLKKQKTKLYALYCQNNNQNSFTFKLGKDFFGNNKNINPTHPDWAIIYKDFENFNIGSFIYQELGITPNNSEFSSTIQINLHNENPILELGEKFIDKLPNILKKLKEYGFNIIYLLNGPQNIKIPYKNDWICYLSLIIKLKSLESATFLFFQYINTILDSIDSDLISVNEFLRKKLVSFNNYFNISLNQPALKEIQCYFYRNSLFKAAYQLTHEEDFIVEQ